MEKDRTKTTPRHQGDLIFPAVCTQKIHTKMWITQAMKRDIRVNHLILLLVSTSSTQHCEMDLPAMQCLALCYNSCRKLLSIKLVKCPLLAPLVMESTEVLPISCNQSVSTHQPASSNTSACSSCRFRLCQLSLW